MSASPEISIEIVCTNGSPRFRVRTGWLDLADLKRMVGWIDAIRKLDDAPAVRESKKRGGAAGGAARAAALSPERRSEIAKSAAETRWGASR